MRGQSPPNPNRYSGQAPLRNFEMEMALLANTRMPIARPPPQQFQQQAYQQPLPMDNRQHQNVQRMPQQHQPQADPRLSNNNAHAQHYQQHTQNLQNTHQYNPHPQQQRQHPQQLQQHPHPHLHQQTQPQHHASKPQPKHTEHEKQPSPQSETDADNRLADYHRAQQYFNQHSYCHKRIHPQNGTVSYQRFQTLEPNASFKQYSVGVYLYLDMLRILIWFYLVCSIVACAQMYFNFLGTGLSSFPQSYTIIAMKTSLGNNTTATFQEVLIQTLCDAGIVLLLLLFVIVWRKRTANILFQIEQDMSILDPQKYALSVTFGKGTQPRVSEIMPFVEENFSKLYEVTVVYDFKRKFSKFEDLDQLDTEIRLLEIKQIQTGKGERKLQKLQQKREKLYRLLSSSDLKPTPICYIIHFMTLQDKARFIKAMEKYSSIDETYYNFKKAILPCSVAKIPPKFMLKDNLFPVVKERRCGRPEDIRWENLDISGCEKFIRFIIGIIFILVVLAIASLTIAVCSIYVSVTNDCTNFDPNTSLTTAQVSTDMTLVYCYCDKHILSYFSDTGVYNLCQSFSQDIIVKTLLQFVAAATSTITNILIAVLVSLLISFMKPRSNSDAHVTNFVSILIATLINSVTIPLLLNASIFGGRPVLFFSWINFKNFSTLQSYSDFSRNWYAYVAPFYLNFFLIAVITPWLNLIKISIIQCIKRIRLKNSEGKTIQKLMNRDILDYSFNLPMEAASVLLYLFFSLMYSSCMPVLVVLTLVILISQYTASKIVIGKYSRQVSANEQINEKIIKYMPWALLLHVLFAMWSFTCPEVFTGSLFDKIKFNIKYFNNDLDRIFNIEYLLGLAVFLLGAILIDIIIIRSFIWLAECCGGDKAEQARYAREKLYSERLKAVNVLGSYNIVKNPEYKASMRLVNEILHNPFNGRDELNDTLGPLMRKEFDGTNLQQNQDELLQYFRSNMPNRKPQWNRAELHRKSEKGSPH